MRSSYRTGRADREADMSAEDRTLIRVNREWNGWRSAEVRLADLRGVHWFQPIGAHHPLLHAYIWCTTIVSGDIPHACDDTPAPHSVMVCVLKRHAVPTVYAELARRADEEHRAAAGRLVVRDPGARTDGRRTA
jgi:hypothetical protein